MWIIQNYSQTKSRLCKCIHYFPEHLQENRGISAVNNYPLCQRVAERTGARAPRRRSPGARPGTSRCWQRRGNLGWGGLGVPLSLPRPSPLYPLVLSLASCGAGQLRGRGVPDKGALETPHGLINATCLSLRGLRGLLIIFIKKIISPNQGRSSPELQLIKRLHIFLFYKKSCGADENYRPLEAA